MAAGGAPARTETQRRPSPRPRSVVGGLAPWVVCPAPVPLSCSACAEAGATCDACMAKALGFQRAPRLGAADDPFEAQADWVADLVAEGLAALTRLGSVGQGGSRLCSHCAAELEEELPNGVQRKAGAELLALGSPGEHRTPALLAAVLGSAGNPLTQPARAYFEPLQRGHAGGLGCRRCHLLAPDGGAGASPRYDRPGPDRGIAGSSHPRLVRGQGFAVDGGTVLDRGPGWASLGNGSIRGQGWTSSKR